MLDWQIQDAPKIGEARALAVLRQAAAARPDDLVLKLRLARMLYAHDAMDELVALLHPLADPPDEALFQLGRAAARLERFDIALPALERCGEPAARGILAGVLADAGRPDDALRMAREALEADAEDRQALFAAGKVLVARSDTPALLALTRTLFARGVRNARLLSLLALAAWAENAPEVTMLLERGLFSHGAEDLDAALKDELLGHPALGRSQSYKATRGEGARIEHLEAYGGSLAQALLAKVRRAVEAYVDERSSFAGHPALAARGRKLGLHAWALVLRGDGYEAAHIHPGAWLSGVYYVAVPAGRIGFGPVEAIPGRDMTGFPSWDLLPRAGDLLLFPSYFAHRTWPTASDPPRISVAFDVVPI